MNIDKSNSATPVSTDKIVVNRQDITDYSCTLKKISDYVKSTITSPTYISYVALLNKANDTNPPTPIVLYNNLGATPTINYVDDGYYTITCPGIFVDNKTVAFMSGVAGNSYTACYTENIAGTITITIYNSAGNANFVGKNQPIEIRVYS